MFPLMVFTKSEKHLFKISRVTCTLIEPSVSQVDCGLQFSAQSCREHQLKI